MIQYYVSTEFSLEYYDLIEKFPSVPLKHSLVGGFLFLNFFGFCFGVIFLKPLLNLLQHGFCSFCFGFFWP